MIPAMKEIFALLRKDFAALLAATLLTRLPGALAGYAGLMICLDVFSEGYITGPIPAEVLGWLWMISGLLALIVSPWLRMGLFGGLTDSLRGGKLRWSDPFMFTGRFRKALKVRIYLRLLTGMWMVPGAILLWALTGMAFGGSDALLVGLAFLLLPGWYVRLLMAFVPALQADYPKMSGMELAEESRELVRRLGWLRFVLLLLPGLAAMALLAGGGFHLAVTQARLAWLWLLLAVLLWTLPMMYLRAALSAAYVNLRG